jgi:hypothetical protein
MRPSALAAVTALLLAAAGPAAAAERPVLSPGSSAAAWGILGWNDSAGLGLSGQLAVVPGGLIHDPNFRARDSVDLDFGLDWLSHWRHYTSGASDYEVSTLSVHTGLIWNFWLTPKVAIYPKLGIGYSFAHYTGNTSNGHVDFDGLYPELAFGGLVKLQDGLDLRAELGWAGLKLGVGFRF